MKLQTIYQDRCQICKICVNGFLYFLSQLLFKSMYLFIYYYFNFVLKSWTTILVKTNKYYMSLASFRGNKYTLFFGLNGVFFRVDNVVIEDCTYNKFMDGNVCKGIWQNQIPLKSMHFVLSICYFSNIRFQSQ